MGPDEKAKYEEMAAKDKKRYEKEMESYKPPASSPKAGSKKKKKDPNAPKRAMTSFFYFSKEMRPKVKEENPEMTFGELGKKIGELFRGLSADEKEKYEELAKKDKERYQREMAEYKSSSKVEEDDDDDDSDSDGVDNADEDLDSDSEDED